MSKHSFGTLYIVATPIGNLEDITLRALDTLKKVDLILAEDTRNTKNLLTKYAISTHAVSYHQQSAEAKKFEIVKKLIEGENLALVTDAGTPGVSDPGNELVDFVRAAEPNIQIIPIPGASSLTAAISVSGMNLSNFIFLGFLGKKKGKKLLKEAKKLNQPIVFFESPHRIIKTITDLMEIFGPQHEVFIAQELTKLHERTVRGSLSKIKEELLMEEKEAGRVRGEIVVIFS